MYKENKHRKYNFKINTYLLVVIFEYENITKVYKCTNNKYVTYPMKKKKNNNNSLIFISEELNFLIVTSKPTSISGTANLLVPVCQQFC